MMSNDAEHDFMFQCRAYGLPDPKQEFMFARSIGRRWRADFLWGKPHMLIVEIQGGVWNRGKHGRGSGVVKDYERLNAAQLLGYRVLQFTTGQVESGEAVAMTEKALLENDGTSRKLQ